MYSNCPCTSGFQQYLPNEYQDTTQSVIDVQEIQQQKIKQLEDVNKALKNELLYQAKLRQQQHQFSNGKPWFLQDCIYQEDNNKMEHEYTNGIPNEKPYIHKKNMIPEIPNSKDKSVDLKLLDSKQLDQSRGIQSSSYKYQNMNGSLKQPSPKNKYHYTDNIDDDQFVDLDDCQNMEDYINNQKRLISEREYYEQNLMGTTPQNKDQKLQQQFQQQFEFQPYQPDTHEVYHKYSKARGENQKSIIPELSEQDSMEFKKSFQSPDKQSFAFQKEPQSPQHFDQVHFTMPESSHKKKQQAQQIEVIPETQEELTSRNNVHDTSELKENSINFSNNNIDQLPNHQKQKVYDKNNRTVPSISSNSSEWSSYHFEKQFQTQAQNFNQSINFNEPIKNDQPSAIKSKSNASSNNVSRQKKKISFKEDYQNFDNRLDNKIQQGRADNVNIEDQNVPPMESSDNTSQQLNSKRMELIEEDNIVSSNNFSPLQPKKIDSNVSQDINKSKYMEKSKKKRRLRKNQDSDEYASDEDEFNTVQVRSSIKVDKIEAKTMRKIKYQANKELREARKIQLDLQSINSSNYSQHKQNNQDSVIQKQNYPKSGMSPKKSPVQKKLQFS